MEQIEVEKVVQVDGPDQANEKLALGYSLLAVVPAINRAGTPYVAYVLGMPKSRTQAPQGKSLEELGEQLC